jgi:hypothetical protein
MSHLDDEVLLAFQLERLRSRHVLSVAAHVLECERCSSRLEELTSGLDAADALLSPDDTRERLPTRGPLPYSPPVPRRTASRYSRRRASWRRWPQNLVIGLAGY